MPVPTPEDKARKAAEMRARYEAKKTAARSKIQKAVAARDDPARNATDLHRLPDPVSEPEPPSEDVSIPLPEPTFLAARTSAPISEKMKDHLQRASALGLEAQRQRRAIGNGVKEGKTYKSSADLIRKFLEDGRKGAVNPRGQTRLIQMIENMHHIATSGSPRAVHAFQALMERAYGKPKPSEESLDALARGGVQIVYVAPPELPTSEPRQLKPKPEFIDAEVVDND